MQHIPKETQNNINIGKINKGISNNDERMSGT